MILPPSPLNVPRLVLVPDVLTIRFFNPSSNGNPMASDVALLLAFLAYFRISVFDNLILKAVSSKTSGPRYSCGMCKRKDRSSELVGQEFNK